MKVKVELSFSAKVSANIELGDLVNGVLNPNQRKQVDKLLEEVLAPKLKDKVQKTNPKTTIKAI